MKDIIDGRLLSMSLSSIPDLAFSKCCSSMTQGLLPAAAWLSFSRWAEGSAALKLLLKTLQR